MPEQLDRMSADIYARMQEIYGLIREVLSIQHTRAKVEEFYARQYLRHIVRSYV